MSWAAQKRDASAPCVQQPRKLCLALSETCQLAACLPWPCLTCVPIHTHSLNEELPAVVGRVLQTGCLDLVAHLPSSKGRKAGLRREHLPWFCVRPCASQGTHSVHKVVAVLWRAEVRHLAIGQQIVDVD